ncbi:hypothetical protein [Flavobacterium sp. N3904]|uniref:hypothetical protein n=1 Tax=Flavobacterium sp. N3904 TaxID=2986835 RepID=UPI0022255AD5|nr:hypothetical protein [Flavobacterium sp. N3904]
MKNKETKTIFSSLEDFSSIPPPELWDKIEAQLDEPKKNKRAIIWWTIAASLVVGLSVPAILYFNSNQQSVIELNMENNADGVVFEKNLEDNTNIDKGRHFNGNVKSNSNSKNSFNQNRDNDSTDKKTTIVKLNTIQIHSNHNQIVTISNNSSIAEKKSRFKNADQNKRESKSNSVVANQNSTSIASTSKLIVGNTVEVANSNSSDKALVNNENKSISQLNADKDDLENSISKSSLSIDKSTQVSNINANKVAITNQETSIEKPNSNKKSIESAISKDSLSKIKSEVAQLEQALVQVELDKTKKKTISESIDKWSLQVFAGVMSSQNYNNEKALGNTVDSKQSNGYGVKTNYKLNKKWGISSGFKINELGQKIAGVSYYEQQSRSGIVSGTLPIVNTIYQPSSSKNNYEIVFISNNQDYMFASNSNVDNGFEKGNVTQNLKYFEMPLEVSYVLLSKKKANITMNTGGFVGKLISNDIALNGNSIGENKNVNDYVYGTLLSSTLQYEIYKKTKFFIEPGMNYYVNPLENQSFNQFQLVFNVGLNVSF